VEKNADNNKNNEIQKFKSETKVLKNLLHGELWYDFFKMGAKKILLGKYPSYPGKTKITIVNFLMNIVRAPPKAKTKKCLPEACIQKKSNHGPVDSFKN
jgi:hypothetical protein